MAEHPIENLMMTAMTSLENMIDVNTVVGDIVTTQDGTVIIPISKVCFGFAAGGSEFNTNKLNKFSEEAKLPFGGGSGAGVNISPMGFLIVKDNITKLLTFEGMTSVDKMIDMIPDVINKATEVITKTKEKPEKTLENDTEDIEDTDDPTEKRRRTKED